MDGAGAEATAGGARGGWITVPGGNGGTSADWITGACSTGAGVVWLAASRPTGGGAAATVPVVRGSPVGAASGSEVTAAGAPTGAALDAADSAAVCTGGGRIRTWPSLTG